MAKTSEKKLVGGVKNVPQKKVASPSRVSKKKPGLKSKDKTSKKGEILKKNNARITGKKLLVQEHEAKNPVAILISDKTATPSTVIGRVETHLALLSPFRFPVPYEAYIAPIARAAGVFFVIVGAFFSLLNLEYATGIVTTPSDQNIFSYAKPSVNSATVALNNAGDSPQVPGIQLFLPGDGAISGEVPVSISVPGASSVILLGKNVTQGFSFTLGNATKIDDATWRYVWTTTNFENANYRLSAVVTFPDRTYTKVDEKIYTLANNLTEDIEEDVEPEVHEDEVAEITNTTGSDVTDVPPTEESVKILDTNKATLSLLDSVLSGLVPITVDVLEAQEVKVYARSEKTGNLTYIGLATKVTDQKWGLKWRTSNVIDGRYALQAKIQTPDSHIETPRVMVTVANNVINGIIDSTLATSTDLREEIPTKVDTDISDLKPSVTLRLPSNTPVSGVVPVYVQSTPVDWIELYAIGKSSNTAFFIGLAERYSEKDWKLNWVTTQLPNGTYFVYPRTQSSYGYFEGSRQTIVVQNEMLESFSKEQEDSIDTMTKVSDSLKIITDGREIFDAATTSSEEEKDTISPNLVYVESVDSFVDSINSDSALKEKLSSFRKLLDQRQVELARAIRTNDEGTVQKIKEEIELMKNNLIQELPNTIDKKEIIDRINGYLSQVAFQTMEVTANNEKVIRDRIGDQVFKDSDLDTISDYDEINLYRTNPFSADTDADGYMDGSEVLLGYNPHDTTPESIVVYESPKESGIQREDLLLISTITTLPIDADQSTTTDTAQALLSGKALPNSFVTLYIYSTPIVVTVRTDSEGNWSYIIDKDLEDGEHEVYVGITDNTGKIVAKSESFAFVKTAEAYSPKQESSPLQPLIVNPEPTFYESKMLILVASISIVALGLVLVLLGLHVHTRKEDEELQTVSV